MVRLKPRHERFCQRFIECANAAAAAKAAGYTPASARNAGYRLLCNPRIIERIAEIQAEIAKAQCRHTDALLGKLETVYRRAIEDNQFSAAARAIELQAKLAGLTDLRTAVARDKRTAPQPNSEPMEAADPRTDAQGAEPMSVRGTTPRP